jgi:hypothetical protein
MDQDDHHTNDLHGSTEPLREVDQDTLGFPDSERVPEAKGGLPMYPVERLKTVDKETLRALLERKREAERERQIDRSEKIVSPGLFVINESAYIAFPSNIFNSDCEFGILLATTAVELGYIHLKEMVEDKNFFTAAYNRKFILGVLNGLTTSTYKTRSQSKKDYDLGTACGYALRVKHYFAQNKKLTADALVEDHFFFGNSRKEMKGKGTRVYHMKDQFASYCNQDTNGRAILTVVNYIARQYLLDNHSTEDLEKAISANVIPFPELMASLYPRRTVQVTKKKTEVKVLKPSLPKTSTLFTKKEMSLITKILRPSFTDITDIQEKYIHYINQYGYHQLSDQLRARIQTRRELTQKFGRVCKTRFQAIELIASKKGLRRNEVTTELLSTYIQGMTDPVTNLVREIQQILSRTLLHRNAEIAFNKRMESQESAIAFVTNLSFGIYRESFPEMNLDWKLKTADTAVALRDSRIKDAMEYIFKLDAALGKMELSIEPLSRIQSKYAYRHLESIQRLTHRINDYCNELVRIEERDRNVASKTATNSSTTFDSLMAIHKESYDTKRLAVRNRCAVLYYNANQDDKRLISELLQQMDDCELISPSSIHSRNH